LREDPRQVGAAPAHPALAALATALPADVHLGPSSWNYPGWAGLVYDRPHPEATLGARGAGVASAWPTVGLLGVDRSFHAPLPASAWAALAGAVRPGTRLLAKAPRVLTDPSPDPRDPSPNDRFLDGGWSAGHAAVPFRDGAGAAAGPLVFQLAPDARRGQDPDAFLARLRRFLAAQPPGLLLAVELRDPALLRPAYRTALRDTGAVHCFSVQAPMPDLDAQWALAGEPDRPFVARWLLRPPLRYAEAVAAFSPFDALRAPDPANRRCLARRIAAAHRAGQPSFVSVANRAEGCAPLSIAGLAEATLAALGHRPAASAR